MPVTAVSLIQCITEGKLSKLGCVAVAIYWLAINRNLP